MLSSSLSPREDSLSPQSKHTPSITPPEGYSPNNIKYYNNHLNKSQFNLILINCSINLMRILYGPNIDEAKLRFFIFEILRRSRASTQTLQISCYYMVKLMNTPKEELPACPKKFFLSLVILSSKFNQDHNYSFKSWLKICGCKGDEASTLNLQSLRQVEAQMLRLLNYDLYINGAMYENWCNVLLVFGYDFISLHEVNLGILKWCDDSESRRKLLRWQSFLKKLDVTKLQHVPVNFKQYYSNQIGTKVVTRTPMKQLSLFGKREFDTSCDESHDAKKIRKA